MIGLYENGSGGTCLIYSYPGEQASSTKISWFLWKHLLRLGLNPQPRIHKVTMPTVTG